MSWLYLFLGIMMITALILIHEWGHFIAARRSGVDVEEYGLGFPPRAKVITKKNGTEYTLNWMPVGGFVRLKGEHDSDKGKGTYGSTKTSNKIKIMMAGVFMNLVVAFVILTALAAIGMPQLVDNQFKIASDSKLRANQVLIGLVEDSSPAAKAGLLEQDVLKSITGADGQSHPVDSSTNITRITSQLAGQQVTVTYLRNGQIKQTTTTLRGAQEVNASKHTDNPKGYLGISPIDFQTRQATWSAPIVALGTMWQYTVLTLGGLGHAMAELFRGHPGQASQGVGGPILIVAIIKHSAERGLAFLFFLMSIISLTLAILNTLPIPALDGGRLFVTLLYRIRRKPLTSEKEDAIHGTGMAVLLLLVFVITILDIHRVITHQI